jgi:hypothetical protein
LEIAVENVCHVIALAREMVADMDELPDEPGQHAPDDIAKEELPEEDDQPQANSPEYEELKEFLEGLNDDELFELIAMAWIGRGTFTAEDWDEAVETARDEHPRNAMRYLLGMALLADYLEEGLSELGLSCEDVD